MAETDWIDELSDVDAVTLLKRFAAGNQREAEVRELTPAVREALGAAAGVSSGAAAGAASEGELARLTLQLLATSDPRMAATLASLHAGPRVEAFGLALTVGVITAAIIALQTKLKFEAKDGGKWSVKVEKGALNDILLKDVIAKLLGLAGGRAGCCRLGDGNLHGGRDRRRWEERGHGGVCSRELKTLSLSPSHRGRRARGPEGVTGRNCHGLQRPEQVGAVQRKLLTGGMLRERGRLPSGDELLRRHAGPIVSGVARRALRSGQWCTARERVWRGALRLSMRSKGNGRTCRSCGGDHDREQ